MAATIIINRLTSTGPTLTNITSSASRLSASDAADPGTSDPIEIPDAGTNYSYWHTSRLQCTVAPSGTVDNLRWHPVLPNNFGTGITAKGNTANGYVQATGTQGETGDILNTTNHTSLAGATSDIWTYTEASPKSITGSTTGTGEFGDRWVFQIEVASTASAGTISSHTARWRYDET